MRVMWAAAGWADRIFTIWGVLLFVANLATGRWVTAGWIAVLLCLWSVVLMQQAVLRDEES